MDSCRVFNILKQILIVSIICQILLNLSVLSIAACISIDPRKADFKTHGLVMLILSVMFLCILAGGACGVIGECPCVLLLFAILMTVGFIVDGLSHSLIYLTSFNQSTSTPQQLKFSLQDYDNEKRIKEIWDITHKKEKCCGITGPENWLSANMSIPPSCCHTNVNRTSNQQPSVYCIQNKNGQYLFEKGCFKKIVNPIFFFEIQADLVEENAPVKPTKKRKFYKEHIIYLIVFNYSIRFLSIITALGLVWIMW